MQFSSLSQSSLKVGAVNTYNFTFNAEHNIVQNGKIKISFPTEIGITSSVTVSASVYGEPWAVQSIETPIISKEMIITTLFKTSPLTV